MAKSGAPNRRTRAERHAANRRSGTAPVSSDATQFLGSRWAADAVCCAVVLAICLVVGLSRYRNGINIGDEGLLAYGAERVLQGDLPNRDFASLQPPLAFYTSAGAFWLLGTSLAALRTLGLAIYVLIPLVVYAVVRQRSRHLVSLSAAVPAAILGMPYSNFVPFGWWHGVLAALITAVLVIRAVTTGRTSWAVFAGLATTATALSRHDQGFYVAVAVLAYGLLLGLTGQPDIGRRARRMVAYWAAGAVIPLSLLGALWYASGAIPSMYRQLVVFPLTTYAKTSSLPMPGFHSGMPIRDVLEVSLFYVPPIVDALAMIWLAAVFVRRRARVEDAHFAFLVVLSSLFYCQVLARSDLSHLMMTFGPWFVVLAWSMSALVKRTASAIGQRTSGPWVSRAVLPLVCAVPLLTGAWALNVLKPVVLRYVDSPLETLNLPRSGVRIDASDVAPIEAIVGFVWEHAPADRAILSLPYSPMFYFLSERRNPTQWNYLWPGDQSREDHRQLIEQARADPPAVVLLTDGDAMLDYAGVLLGYVMSSFKPARDFGPVKAYLPANDGSIIR